MLSSAPEVSVKSYLVLKFDDETIIVDLNAKYK